MASAFGTPDGGRSLWENAWHASVERLQGQKSHPSNPETPLQSRSGTSCFKVKFPLWFAQVSDYPFDNCKSHDASSITTLEYFYSGLLFQVPGFPLKLLDLMPVKLMADEALVSSANIHPGQSSDGVSILGKATPASILKGDDGTNCSSSILVAAREAARRRVEAASAASKRAENLDAIVKAAELAAEAVSQAGKIVAMGDPLPLSELVEAGPEGYWKASQVLSEPVVRLNNTNRVQAGNNVEEDPDKHPKVSPSDKKETHMVNHGKPLTRREMSRELVEDHTRLVDGMPSSVTSSENDSRGQKGRKVSDLAKTTGVVPESEVGSRSNSIAVQNEYERTTENLKENSVKEGSLVEVFKDGDGSKAAWFSANVLSLKDQKAYVCYAELPSDEGSGQLKEWVALESEGDKPPRIRFAHPMTAIQFEGTRKRRRAAIGDYAWSVGDRVDVWVQNWYVNMILNIMFKLPLIGFN
uniref:Agenet-like domain-containing protein n=2 Tax=Vitis vinifera TaxID=29760 RepID=F6I1M3_VITVI